MQRTDCRGVLTSLCDHALLLAYVEGERPVSEATVREALEDLKQLPLHWNEPTAAVSPLETLRAEASDALRRGDERPRIESDGHDR